MAASKQEALRGAWLGGRVGTLTARDEARAWALREVWKAEGKSSYGMLTHVASKVCKIAAKGAKRAKREHPSPSALSQLFDKIDTDKNWFPGKNEQEQFGPAAAISGTNQGIIARSAMAMKEQGKEPTYGLIVGNNPKCSSEPSDSPACAQEGGLQSLAQALL